MKEANQLREPGDIMRCVRARASRVRRVVG